MSPFLICACFGTQAAASTARSQAERDYILRFTRRWIIVFCFLMSIGLAAVLSQAGKLYRPSAAGIVLSVCAWTGVLVGGIMLLCRRMDRDVQRIRVETQTTDADHIHWRILLSLAITLVLCAWRARQRRHSAEVLGA